MLSMDGLLRWIGAPQPGFVPLNFIPRSSFTIITPLANPALHIRHCCFPGGTPLFPWIDHIAFESPFSFTVS